MTDSVNQDDLVTPIQSSRSGGVDLQASGDVNAAGDVVGRDFKVKGDQVHGPKVQVDGGQSFVLTGESASINISRDLPQSLSTEEIYEILDKLLANSPELDGIQYLIDPTQLDLVVSTLHQAMEFLIAHGYGSSELSPLNLHIIGSFRDLAHDCLEIAIKKYLEEHPAQETIRQVARGLAIGVKQWKATGSVLPRNLYKQAKQFSSDIHRIDRDAMHLLIQTSLEGGYPGLDEWLARSNDLDADIQFMISFVNEKNSSDELDTQQKIRSALKIGLNSKTSKLDKKTITEIRRQFSREQRPSKRSEQAYILTQLSMGGPVTFVQRLKVLPSRMAAHKKEGMIALGTGTIVLAIIGLIAFLNWRGQGEWTPIGPYRRPVVRIAIDPVRRQSVYVIANGNRYGQPLYHSEDAGLTWSKILTATTPCCISAAAVVYSGTTPTLLIGRETGGVFGVKGIGTESPNVVAQNEGLTSAAVGSIDTDPNHPNVAYLGTTDRHGIFQSTDAGHSWSQIGGFELANMSIVDIALSAEPPNVYVAAENDYVYRLVALKPEPRWEKITSDNLLVSSLGNGHLTGLFVDDEAHRLYATTSLGIIKYVDNPDQNNEWFPIAISQESNAQADIVEKLAIMHGNRPALLAVTSGTGGTNVYRSLDSGNNWERIQDPTLSKSTANDLEALPGNATPQLLLASDSGLYRTSDLGATWSSVQLDYPMALASVFYLPRHMDAPLYAGVAGTIYKTSEPANSTQYPVKWEWAGSGLDTVIVRTLTGDPTDSQTLYAGGYRPRLWPLFVTYNGGKSWQQFGEPPADKIDDDIRSLVVVDLPDRSNVVIAGTNGSGIYRTEDQGNTWTIQQPPFNVNYGSLTVDPYDTNKIVALGDNKYIYRSNDTGKTWEMIGASPASSSPASIFFGFRSPGTLYVASPEGVSQSLDAGKSWRPITTRLSDKSVYGIRVLPVNGETIYVTTNSGLVYASDNEGRTWNDIRYNLDVAVATDVASNIYDYPILFLNTTDGVFRYSPNWQAR